jgi:adenylate cyclase
LTSGGEVAPDEARRALERVLDSAEFAQATRLSDFLRHVVTETLEGRAASLKGYSIAVDVFGRPDDFDQASDPIVRVEASRLRRALAQYYQGSGNGDPVVIELPRGAYVPAFRRRGAVEEPAEAEPDEAAEGEAAPPAPPPPPRADRDVVRFRIATLVGLGLALLGLAYLVWSNLAGRQTAETPPPPAGMMARAVAVADLEVLGEAADSADFARGLATALLTELTRFHDLDVSALETGSNPPSAGYILRGAAAHAGPTLRVTLQLVEARGGRAVWSETYERDYKADQVLAIETEIARTAARELAQPYGAIYAREIEAIAGADPKTLTGYACVLLTYEYWRSFDPKAHFEARDCLERTVAATPGYAAAWQALAYLARNEGIQQSALAEILELEPITLGRILDRLEAAELVERRRHAADRRVWLLHLKPKAHALMADMFNIGDATRAEALAGVSEADRATLTRILIAMKANLADACGRPVEDALPARRASHG